ncbi:Eukaryotic translation initiation factor 3 subunit 10 [Sphingobium herbicidovorans NBRC 16415]|uniref:Eukaryotic translation initiation factor 3 subunit 10 n=1 Tax=Sphingobium herbicidovorans (strain ATCC 700291 / DSM 11019 / CCUG 56400 / KCTC 2939 / LMG 18315 / NBRC 16415 / MH) TaxID=1219045 RepID=A0A086P5D6_SPHHM|nr:DUF4167 domain-containing protein [Sphingobium herbicidovorans]KFG88604.1 Eukaryotic translation initiation factor 3 subunit 10 [Sphingobium herbicidovorans NBRC 16415]
MINNRQAGRRNRGRNNNGRPSGGNRGGGDNGNRIDSRARGNAAQLLEKYKNMARDAQMAGDRVNAEYYLQFADHYFRVLADNRARQEEQQQRYRRPDDNLEYEGEDFDTSDFAGDDNRGEVQPQQQYDRGYEGDRRREQPRDQREPREAREQREPRDHREQQDQRDSRGRRDRPRRDRPAYEGAEQPQVEAAEAAVSMAERAPEPQAEAEAPRPRRGRPRKADVAKSEGSEGLDLAVLPPSIARADNDSEPGAEEAPRKRTRRARPAAEAAE